MAIYSGYAPFVSTFSGFISSGQSISFSSPIFSSGFIFKCSQCNQSLPPLAHTINVSGNSYCHKCAGYDPIEGFTRRAEDILRSVPCHDAPWGVIADWLEDNNREQDATWVRENRC